MSVETPEDDEKLQRNNFLETLAPEAKVAFLHALESAAERGLSERAAWEEAVAAAQLAYRSEPGGSGPP